MSAGSFAKGINVNFISYNIDLRSLSQYYSDTGNFALTFSEFLFF